MPLSVSRLSAESRIAMAIMATYEKGGLSFDSPLRGDLSSSSVWSLPLSLHIPTGSSFKSFPMKGVDKDVSSLWWEATFPSRGSSMMLAGGDTLAHVGVFILLSIQKTLVVAFVSSLLCTSYLIPFELSRRRAAVLSVSSPFVLTPCFRAISRNIGCAPHFRFEPKKCGANPRNRSRWTCDMPPISRQWYCVAGFTHDNDTTPACSWEPSCRERPLGSLAKRCVGFHWYNLSRYPPLFSKHFVQFSSTSRQVECVFCPLRRGGS